MRRPTEQCGLQLGTERRELFELFAGAGPRGGVALQDQRQDDLAEQTRLTFRSVPPEVVPPAVTSAFKAVDRELMS